MDPKIGLSEEVRDRVIGILNTTLADEHALYVNRGSASATSSQAESAVAAHPPDRGDELLRMTGRRVPKSAPNAAVR